MYSTISSVLRGRQAKKANIGYIDRVGARIAPCCTLRFRVVARTSRTFQLSRTIKESERMKNIKPPGGSLDKDAEGVAPPTRVKSRSTTHKKQSHDISETGQPQACSTMWTVSRRRLFHSIAFHALVHDLRSECWLGVSRAALTLHRIECHPLARSQP